MGMFDFLQEDAPQADQPQGGMFDFLKEDKRPSALETTKDVGKSTAAGLGRGTVALAGMPGDIQSLSRAAGKKLGFEPPSRSILDGIAAMLGGDRLPTSQDAISSAAKVVPGLEYQPETTAGQYARTAAEFVPGALLAPESLTARGLGATALKYGVVPGLASEGAGQMTQGTSAEPWARVAGGLAGGGVSALGDYIARSSAAGNIIREAAGNLTAQQLDDAERLMMDARNLPTPVMLSRAEAVQQVTGGATRLGDLQRSVEGHGGLHEFYAQRPQQIEAAGRGIIGQLAPITDNPSMIGKQTAEAANQIVKGRQGAINRATRTLYDAGARQNVPPAAQAALMQDPLYARALDEVLTDPAMNRRIAGLPQDSQAVADLVRQRLQEQASTAATPGQASTSNIAASNYGDAARAARAASPAIDPARAAQARLRQQYLEPLVNGPLGKVMDRPDTKQAVNALFPQNPVPNSAGEVFDAVQRLSRRAPAAAQQLVRAHVESVFNQSTKDLQSGAAQWGGATFRAKLVGNPQAEANLEAAVTAMHRGEDVWPGFQRFLDVMEATGQRQRLGSTTSFNEEIKVALREGTPLREAGQAVVTGGFKIPARIKEKIEQLNLRNNTAEIARLLTDPQAADAFRRMALARTDNQLTGNLVRLINIAESSKRDRRK